MPKFTIKQIQEKSNKINPNIEVITDFYKEMGNTVKVNRRYVKCKCRLCNHEWSTLMSNLLQGYGCPECERRRRSLTLEGIKGRLLKINSNIEILSDKYLNNSTKLKCKCLICNNVWEVRWNDLQNGKGCPICNDVKKTLEGIKAELLTINPNIKILSDEYIGSHSKILCKCLIDGYKWKATWAHLYQGEGCPKCKVKKLSLSLEKIKKRLKIISPNIKILSKEYANNYTKLKCRCLVDSCKNEWEVSWESLAMGNGCPKCGIKKLSGKNNYNWKGGISDLHEYLRSKIAQWKNDSFKKYDYKCDILKIHNEPLIIHHLYNFSNIVKETIDALKLPIHCKINQYTESELKLIDDKCLEIHYKYGLGVCLNKKEHKMFHEMYGINNNTAEQYLEFKKIRLSQLNKNKNEAS